MLNRTIDECSGETKSSVIKNVVLCGGTTLMTGFDTRFKRELLKMDIDTIVICQDNRNSLSFIGANKLASSVSIMNKLWITQKEYQELGNSIVHRKCF